MRKLTIPTLHGEIQTPAFLPDATYGTINSVSFQDATNIGIDEIVTTTLHLELKLGAEYIAQYGGLHKFFHWERPILTDSGGYQVFSLVHRNHSRSNYITDQAAYFTDPQNGLAFELSPFRSQQIQQLLGSDIRVVLDEPLSLDVSAAENQLSVTRTIDWAIKGKKAFLELNHLSETEYDTLGKIGKRPLLTGVVQGANDYDLRKYCAEELQKLNFDIYNYGGLSLDPEGKLDLELSQYLVDLLPQDKPRYAMGNGNPDDIVALAEMGWDLFDCVLPTRNARHGYLYVPAGEGDVNYKHFGVLHIKSERYKFDTQAISSQIPAEIKDVSRAYLRHLLRIKDPSGFRIATLNNLYFYAELMKKLRNKTETKRENIV